VADLPSSLLDAGNHALAQALEAKWRRSPRQILLLRSPATAAPKSESLLHPRQCTCGVSRPAFWLRLCRPAKEAGISQEGSKAFAILRPRSCTAGEEEAKAVKSPEELGQLPPRSHLQFQRSAKARR